MLLESDGKISSGRAEQVWELVRDPWDIKRECSHTAAPGNKTGPEHSTNQDWLLTWMQKTKGKKKGGGVICRGKLHGAFFEGLPDLCWLQIIKRLWWNIWNGRQVINRQCHPLLCSLSLLVAAKLLFSRQRLRVCNASFLTSALRCVWKVSDREIFLLYCKYEQPGNSLSPYCLSKAALWTVEHVIGWVEMMPFHCKLWTTPKVAENLCSGSKQSLIVRYKEQKWNWYLYYMRR